MFILSLLSHLISDKWQAKDGRVKVASQLDAALDKKEDSVQGHSKRQGGQSQKTKVTKKTARFRRLQKQRMQETLRGDKMKNHMLFLSLKESK